MSELIGLLAHHHDHIATGASLTTGFTFSSACQQRTRYGHAAVSEPVASSDTALAATASAIGTVPHLDFSPMPVVSSVSTRQATTRQRASRGSKSSSGGGGSSTTGTGVDATVTQILPRPLADKAHQPGPPDEMCLLDTHQVSRLTIAKIKPCLASRNLSDGGKKATLVSRLQS